MQARRAEPGTDAWWRRPWLLALGPMLLAVTAGLAGATTSAFRSERAFAKQDVVVAVSDSVATAHSPGGARTAELPWLLPGDHDLAISPDGRRLAFVSERDGNAEIYVVDTKDGTVIRRTSDRPGLRAADTRPAWSPGGRLLAWATARGGSSSIQVARADGAGSPRVVVDGGRNTDPAWAPTGRRLVFASDRGGSPGLWLVSVSTGAIEPLVSTQAEVHAPAWSPSGRTIAYDMGGDLWQADVATGIAALLVGGTASDTHVSWSPAGDRLAFARSSFGLRSIQTAAANGTGARRLESSEGEREPVWATVAASLAPPAGALLPDLDQRPPSDLTILRIDGRWALGFTSVVENLGDGALVIRGNRNPREATMQADQVIEFRDGRRLTAPRVGRLRFEPHPPHYHWHLQPFESYELRRVSQPELIVRDRKSGFCLVDRYGNAVLPAPRVVPPRFTSNCASGRPEALHVVEGSSPGYRDRYPAFFHGQDVNVTRLPPGLYTLVHYVNPVRRLREESYTNNVASVLLRLSWPHGRTKQPAVRIIRSCETSARCAP